MTKIPIHKEMNFEEWLARKMYHIRRDTMYVTLYRVDNTLIRRIRLRNGEIIETRIQDKESEVSK